MSVTFVGTSTIVIDNPDFSEKYELSLRTRFKKNILGVLHSIVRPSAYWTLTFSWSKLTRIKTLEFLNWLSNTAGELVALTDHEGDTFSGRIIDREPSVEINHRGHGADTRKEDGRTSIIFEGNAT